MQHVYSMMNDTSFERGCVEERGSGEGFSLVISLVEAYLSYITEQTGSKE